MVALHFCRNEQNGNRITKMLKKKAEELEFADIKFPMKIKDIDKFEKMNNISINVYNFNYCLELCLL
jgi:acyl-ACP thioesterase